MPFPGVTPLSLAILGTASAAVTRLLLDHHADPNKATFDGCTPLHLATTRGSLYPCIPIFLGLMQGKI